MPSGTTAVRADHPVQRAHAGPPEGDRNALKHGGRSAEALASRRHVRALLRETRMLVDETR
jgi:hypothetical protein